LPQLWIMASSGQEAPPGDAEEVAAAAATADASAAVAADETTPAEDPDAAALTQLLAALAAGVRAVRGIPVNDDDADGEERGGRDDRGDGVLAEGGGRGGAFDFERSFPEFAAGLRDAQAALAETASMCVAAAAEGQRRSSATAPAPAAASGAAMFDSGIDVLADVSSLGLDDPILWERCADACDYLMDQVEIAASLDDAAAAAGRHDDLSQQLQRLSTQARYKSQTSMQRMMDGLVDDLPKPQDAFADGFGVQNSRTDPFVPPIRSKPHGTVVPDLDLTPRPGHGLETRYVEGSSASERARQRRSDIVSNPRLVAPSSHVEHPYRPEIEALEYRPWQLEATDIGGREQIGGDEGERQLTATWVDTESTLQDLAREIESKEVREVAIDLGKNMIFTSKSLSCPCPRPASLPHFLTVYCYSIFLMDTYYVSDRNCC